MESEESLKQSLLSLYQHVQGVDGMRHIVKILLKLVGNLMIFPDDPKYRTVNLKNKAIARVIEISQDALNFLKLIGFAQDDEDTLVLSIGVEERNKELIHISMKVLKSFARGVLSLEEGVIPSIDNYPSLITEDDPVFRSSVQNNNEMPQYGDGNSRMEAEIEKLKMEREKKMIDAGVPSDRKLKAIIFKAKANNRPKIPTMQGGEDEFDEQGETELAFRAGKALMDRNKKNQNFTTRAMKELDALKVSKVYIRILLRLQFPTNKKKERLLIEGVFSPLETLDDVKQVLNTLVFDKSKLSSIDNETLKKIYFYKTPPKMVLPLNKSLLDLNLAPAALLYVGFGDLTPVYKGVGAMKELKQMKVTNEISSDVDWVPRVKEDLSVNEDDIDNIANYVENEFPKGEALGPVVPNTVANSNASSKLETTTSNNKKSGISKKKPKWLNL